MPVNPDQIGGKNKADQELKSPPVRPSQAPSQDAVQAPTLDAQSLNRALVTTKNKGNAIVNQSVNFFEQTGSNLRTEVREVFREGSRFVVEQAVMGAVEGALDVNDEGVVGVLPAPKFSSSSPRFGRVTDQDLEKLLPTKEPLALTGA